MGLNIVPEAIRALGEEVALKTDHFDEDTPDEVWIPDVGKRGWIILSKDKNIRRNQIEIVQLLQSGTHSFVLTSGNQKGDQMAAAFVTAMPTIKDMIKKFRPPFVGTVTASGDVRVLMTHDALIDRVSNPPPPRP